jgi:hypothetical protein
MKMVMSQSLFFAMALCCIISLGAMSDDGESWSDDLAKDVARLERMQSLRSTPVREEEILRLFNDIVEKLVLIDDSFVAADAACGSFQCCAQEVELLHDSVASICRINDSLAITQRVSRVTLMQVGPILQTTITLLGVINTTLENKLKEMPNTTEMIEQKVWNKKILRISAGVTTAVVGLVYLGNSYGWWAVNPDITLMGIAQTFLRVIFG